MSSHFKLDERIGEVVPWFAKYHYPTQASRAWKNVTKIPPRNGASGSGFGPTDRISFVLPAQGYANPARIILQFDALLTTSTANARVRFQNGISSIFERATLTYGGLTIEDLRKVNVLTRLMTEGASNMGNLTLDQSSITEGIGGMLLTADTAASLALDNARAAAIHCAQATHATACPSSLKQGASAVRRYTVTFPFGMFQQNKLLPLKWMAPQLAIDLELARFSDAVCQEVATAADATFSISNANILVELLEFDGTYDEAFLDGLRSEGGVPIKFSSFNTYFDQMPTGQSKTVLVPERNRSIKSALTVILPAGGAAITSGTADGTGAALVLPYDSHAFLQSSASLTTGFNPVTNPANGPTKGQTQGNLLSYQFRIGGKYYPNQPVLCSGNGAAEAFVEFQKALNTLGDYRLSMPVNTMRWSHPGNYIDWHTVPTYYYNRDSMHGPSCFVISASFETTDGSEISGLNGEEQNDISLLLNWDTNQDASATILTFTYYDALLILRDNNIAELIK